jgi:hypothetical protein
MCYWFPYAYCAVGCVIALISLGTNWQASHRLSPALFILAHVFWPVSLTIVLFWALLASKTR